MKIYNLRAAPDASRLAGLTMMLLGMVATASVKTTQRKRPSSSTKPAAWKFNSDVPLQVFAWPPGAREKETELGGTPSAADPQIPVGWEWRIRLMTTSAKDWAKLVDQLNVLHRSGLPMPVLEVNGNSTTSSHVEVLARLKGPRRLLLWTGNDSALARIAKLKAIQELEFGGAWRDDCEITNEGLAPLAKLEGLQKLNVPSSAFSPRIGDLGVKHIAGLKSLTSLTLGRFGIRRRTALTSQCLEDIAKLKNLERLQLAGCMGYCQGDGLEQLAGLPKLTSLELVSFSYGLSDSAIVHIGRLKNLRELRLIWSLS
jgi:hypothetical protein